MNNKQKRFKKTLESAKNALDSIDTPFHLHAGTALGAHREKKFIEHDHDIDIAVFYDDVNTNVKLKKIINSMEKNGFSVKKKFGILKRGKEIQFYNKKNKVPLDIFWVYKKKYRNKEYFWVASYYGECDKMKYKICAWAYNPYELKKKIFMGKKYDVVPAQTLVDMYGEDWKILKKFDYFEGIEEHYKGLIPDFFNPIKTDNKVAFCFLLYDKVVHQKIWENFFKQDKNPIKSYNIYSHVKEVNKHTPKWIADNKIKTIKTKWCGVSLVRAFINMLKKGLQNKDNKYFVLLSGECIPLYTFWETYKKITSSKKSRIEIEKLKSKGNIYYYTSQWVILTRKNAEMIIKMDMKKCKEVFKKIGNHCPDEIYPMCELVQKLGKPSSKKFKSQIVNKVVTKTIWGGGSHPVKFEEMNEKIKKDFCDSGALFARKFDPKIVNEIAMKC